MTKEKRGKLPLMLVTRTRRALSIALAGAMMFAQVVYAVDACVDASASAARAVAAADIPGCEKMKSKPSCLFQCNFDKQSSAYSVFTVPPMPTEWVPMLDWSSETSVVVLSDSGLLPRCSWPPPSIQFCRFLL